MEIHRLHEMLIEAGIEHEFRERAEPNVKPRYEKMGIDLGYQVIVYYPNGERMISAVEGWGTYGYGGRWDHGLDGTTEKDGDLIEIMGLLTPEEAEWDSVVGYLTAEEVFRRIKEAVECLK